MQGILEHLRKEDPWKQAFGALPVGKYDTAACQAVVMGLQTPCGKL